MEENPYQPSEDIGPLQEPPRPRHDPVILIAILAILAFIALVFGGDFVYPYIRF